MIPIRNIFYMYCYAWGKFPEGVEITTGSEDAPDLQSLLAEVLLRSLAGIERRGIDRNYVSGADQLKTVRGHILMSETMNTRIRDRVAIVCEHDDLSVDIPQNQILKSALNALVSTRLVDRSQEQKLKSAIRRLSSVSDIRLNGDVFRLVRLNRNNSYYDLALRVCRLVYDRLIPDQRGSGSRFVDPASDEKLMARVFEDFVRNFLRTNSKSYSTSSLEMNWDAQALSQELTPALPSMRADIFLRGTNRSLIIDTKYYQEALQIRFESKTIRSAHLYQMFAYIMNAVRTGRVGPQVEGLLLYPTTSNPIRAVYEIHGHKIMVSTVNLDQHWSDLECELLEIVGRGDQESAMSNSNVGMPV